MMTPQASAALMIIFITELLSADFFGNNLLHVWFKNVRKKMSALKFTEP